MMEYAGFGGLIVHALNLWAIVSIIGSTASIGAEVGWMLPVLLLPIFGFIVRLIAGPRAAPSTV